MNQQIRHSHFHQIFHCLDHISTLTHLGKCYDNHLPLLKLRSYHQRIIILLLSQAHSYYHDHTDLCCAYHLHQAMSILHPRNLKPKCGNHHKIPFLLVGLKVVLPHVQFLRLYANLSFTFFCSDFHPTNTTNLNRRWLLLRSLCSWFQLSFWQLNYSWTRSGFSEASSLHDHVDGPVLSFHIA